MSILSIGQCRDLFRARLKESGYAKASLKGKLHNVQRLFVFLQKESIRDLRDVDRSCMQNYAVFLNAWRKRDGKRLANVTIRQAWSNAKALFDILYEAGLVLSHPMHDITLATQGSSTPRPIMGEADVNDFLDSIDPDYPDGLKDRALFELIYSSALRSGEATRLLVGDVDFESRLIRIRQGKMNKDRVVPMTENAAGFVAELVPSGTDPDRPLFKGRNGKAIARKNIAERFKRRLSQAGIVGEGLCPHSLRHACATHLLAHGADLRYVQELLGHESVETTVRYTNETTENLRKRYLRFHPRENELRKKIDESYTQAFETFEKKLSKRRRDYVNWLPGDRARKARKEDTGKNDDTKA
jgi:site-specific recombinase XerD